MNAFPWKGAARPMPAGAFASAAKAIGCSVAAIRAVWEVESAGHEFLPDGSVIRRFEPHKMPGSTMSWRQSLKIKTAEREKLFAAAYAKAPSAALEATSWGGPQIMGENAAAAGYASALAMVKAMADDADAHLTAFVALVKAWGLDAAIRAHDWVAFATRWNGSGQPAVYARKIETAYRRASGGVASPTVLRVGSRGAAVKRLQAALGIAQDGAFGPDTDAAVRSFQDAQGLPVDGIVGQRTWSALEALRDAEPVLQEAQIDKVTETLTKIGGAATAASAIAATVRDALPETAYEMAAYGAVGLGVLTAALWLIRRARLL